MQDQTIKFNPNIANKIEELLKGQLIIILKKIKIIKLKLFMHLIEKNKKKKVMVVKIYSMKRL